MACGVESAPEPHARFSPTTQSPLLGMYPVGWTRSTTFLPSGVSWEKKCSVTMRWHIPSASCNGHEAGQEQGGNRLPQRVVDPVFGTFHATVLIGHRIVSLECFASPSSVRPDQPVNRGAASLRAQRWNESRMVFGRVPEP